MAKSKTIPTIWRVCTYDVWGNAKDGYEVNNTYRKSNAELDIPVEINNAGTDQEFVSAGPTDKQIRAVFEERFGLGSTRIEIDGDDTHIYVNRVRDGYPIGEMQCSSHESLSPIRARQRSEIIRNELS